METLSRTQMRSLAITGIAAAFAVLPISAAWAQAEIKTHCPVPVESHTPGAYNFKTGTRIEHDDKLNSSYHYKIINCVENDLDDSMDVSWPLPVPAGFPNIDGKVPGHVAFDSFGIYTVTDEATQVGSCLRYGDSGATKRAIMLVPKARADEFLRNDPGDCKRITAQNEIQRGPYPIEDIAQSVVNFFPSRAKEANATMLMFSATAGIEVKAKDRYISYINYGMKPYGKSEGSAEQIVFEPEFPAAPGYLFSDFSKKYGKSIKGASKGEISFTVSDVSKGHLSYAFLGVHDSTGYRVGSISVPVFIPAQ
jgi:hypothetical protein